MEQTVLHMHVSKKCVKCSDPVCCWLCVVVCLPVRLLPSSIYLAGGAGMHGVVMLLPSGYVVHAAWCGPATAFRVVVACMRGAHVDFVAYGEGGMQYAPGHSRAD